MSDDFSRSSLRQGQGAPELLVVVVHVREDTGDWDLGENPEIASGQTSGRSKCVRSLADEIAVYMEVIGGCSENSSN